MLSANRIGCERESRVLFSDLTFNIEPGVLLAVSGINGSGKSSLLKILAGLWSPCSGSVTWQGQCIKAYAAEFLTDLLYIGHKLGIQSPLTPMQNLKWLLGLQNIPEAVSTAQIISVLQSLGLLGVEDLPCEVLSRGQCQKVVLARLWLNPPKCWILDEPFTALDDSSKSHLLNRFDQHLSEGGMIVMASHVPLEYNFSRVEKLFLGE